MQMTEFVAWLEKHIKSLLGCSNYSINAEEWSVWFTVLKKSAVVSFLSLEPSWFMAEVNERIWNYDN
jgi:hypothetical protein